MASDAHLPAGNPDAVRSHPEFVYWWHGLQGGTSATPEVHMEHPPSDGYGCLADTDHSIEGDSSRDHEETTWRMADLYRYLWQYFVDNRVSSVRVWWGALPQEGIGLPGQESAVRDSRRVESREALEKLFYDNNQVVLVRKKTVQCVRGLKEKDRVFRDTYNMD